MKTISNWTPCAKLAMPAGKITIRHRQMRNMFQVFAGKSYLNGASGETPEDAALSLVEQYDVPANSKATVYGFRNPVIIEIPSM